MYVFVATVSSISILFGHILKMILSDRENCYVHFESQHFFKLDFYHLSLKGGVSDSKSMHFFRCFNLLFNSSKLKRTF